MVSNAGRGDGSTNHFRLDETLEGVDLAVIATLDKANLPESPLSNDLECLKVLDALFCSQKPQILNFGSSCM